MTQRSQISPDFLEGSGAQVSEHAQLRALFDLWNGVRDGRTMPSRRDFSPESLRPWLGNLALIDVTRNPIRLHYRLVGIHIVDNLKCDPTGKDFDDVVADPANHPATQGPYRCLMSGEPVFEVVQPRVKGVFSFDYARLSLPLAADSRTINMILMGEYVVSRLSEPAGRSQRSCVAAKVWSN
ncbi:MAG: PAS domain-containing protein [Rhodospirillaceae bacterium]